MARTLFPEYIDRYFRKIAGKFNAEYINGSKQAPRYLVHNLFSEEWTSNLTWASTNISRSIVAADVVAMNASIPLKKRPVLKTTRGDVPKIATKRTMEESDLTNIQILINAGRSEEATKMLATQQTYVIESIEAALENMALTALSTGVLEISNADGVNSIRVNFGYKPENKKAATAAAWSDLTNSKPLDDLEQLFDKAAEDGVQIVKLFMSKKYFDYLRNSDQGKTLYANNAGLSFTSLDNVGRVSAANMTESLKAEYGCEVEVVNTSIRFENPDGTETRRQPWAEANVVGITNQRAGRIVYGTLAEESYPTADVAYTKSGNYTLVSKWSETDPKVELTAAQALAIPVIDNADNIYVLYADRTALLAVSETSVEAGSKGKDMAVKFDAETSVTAQSADSWCTATVDAEKNLVKIVVAANTGTARTTTITLTDEDSNKATITVSQKAGA